MNKVEKKRQKEQYVVEEMIRLYCRKNHGKEGHASGGMCPECQKLADYAKQRSQKCPFMEQKTFCANCKVHCYKPFGSVMMKSCMDAFFAASIISSRVAPGFAIAMLFAIESWNRCVSCVT